MKTFFQILLILGLSLKGNIALAQDPHMREGKSVEELLEKKNPLEFKALENHDKYLVIEKIGSSRRNKFFIGQNISFQTNDELEFMGEITRISDSTFSITHFDNTMQRYEIRMFYLNEINFIHKRILDKGFKYKFSPLFVAPLIFDWITFKTPPWKNKSIGEIFAISAAVEGGRILISNRKKFFNKYKLNEKRRIRVFQY